MLSNAIWEAPTQNKIIPNELMIHFQFIHLVKSVSDLINVICGVCAPMIPEIMH